MSSRVQVVKLNVRFSRRLAQSVVIVINTEGCHAFFEGFEGCGGGGR